MRYPYLSLLIVCVLLSAGALLADPFRQVDVNSDQYKEALKKAQQPVDAPAAVALPLPEIKLNEVPFSDVMDGLRDLTATNLVVNYHALDRAGVDRATPITLARKGISTADVLDEMLKPFAARGVLYRVDKEVVYISTKDDLDALGRFRKRNPALFAVGPLNPRLVVQAMDGGRVDANVKFDVSLVLTLKELARQSGLKVRVDKPGLARVGMDGEEPVFLRLRNPTFGDALAAVLWVTGRIDDLDVGVEGTTVTVIPRAEKVVE